MKTKHLALTVIIGTALFLLLLLPIRSAENLYQSVIRIHVLANSDSEEDQARKLAVRDGILAYTKDRFRAKGRKEAEEALRTMLPELETVAETILKEDGCNHEVTLELGEENYPTRQYEAVSLPAGKYLSLRVKIGEASGQNWWCVLFPPLCLSSSLKAEDALADAGMRKDNISTVIEPDKYTVRFKLLELWQVAKKELEELF